MASGDDTMSPTFYDCAAATGGSSGNGISQRFTFKVDPHIMEEDGPSSKREKPMLRKHCEKLRRDRLNAYIGELAKIVPLVMKSNKKIDKASVLRLTVAYLRIYYDLVIGHRATKKQQKSDLSVYDGLANLLLDTFGGFLVVLNANGILVFATESVNKYLGHNLVDILGCPMSKLVHPDDHALLRRQFEVSSTDLMIDDLEDSGDMDHVPVRGQRSFYIHMQNVSDPQNVKYERVHIVGHIRTMPLRASSPSSAAEASTSLKRKSEVCLVAVATLEAEESAGKITELYPIVNDMPNQWITRHELDGKITYSDQRGAVLTGFLPGESIGLSPYSLVHPDDIPLMVSLHNHFLSKGGLPQSVFRMFTKSRDILYINNNTHLVVDMWTSKPKFIISINEVIDEEKGEEELRKQRDFVAAITNTSDGIMSPGSNTGSSSSHNSCAPSSPGVIPDIVEKGMTVDVVVEEQVFTVNLSNLHITSNVKDPYATNDEGGSNIKLVFPTFLGSDTTESLHSGPSSHVYNSDTEMSVTSATDRSYAANTCPSASAGSPLQEAVSPFSVAGMSDDISSIKSGISWQQNGFARSCNGLRGSSQQQAALYQPSSEQKSHSQQGSRVQSSPVGLPSHFEASATALPMSQSGSCNGTQGGGGTQVRGTQSGGGTPGSGTQGGATVASRPNFANGKTAANYRQLSAVDDSVLAFTGNHPSIPKMLRRATVEHGEPFTNGSILASERPAAMVNAQRRLSDGGLNGETHQLLRKLLACNNTRPDTIGSTGFAQQFVATNHHSRLSSTASHTATNTLPVDALLGRTNGQQVRRSLESDRYAAGKKDYTIHQPTATISHFPPTYPSQVGWQTSSNGCRSAAVTHARQAQDGSNGQHLPAASFTQIRGSLASHVNGLQSAPVSNGIHDVSSSCDSLPQMSTPFLPHNDNTYLSSLSSAPFPDDTESLFNAADTFPNLDFDTNGFSLDLDEIDVLAELGPGLCDSGLSTDAHQLLSNSVADWDIHDAATFGEFINRIA